ncbi:MAG: hypothetical protein AB4290_02370 [Spirulina sp.]
MLEETDNYLVKQILSRIEQFYFWEEEMRSRRLIFNQLLPELKN